MPDDTEPGRVEAAREAVHAGMRAAYRVRLVSFAPGRCAQVMHHGPFADEPATLARLHALIGAEGLVGNGPHHEVYLTDPATTEPARLRTILRQPVRPA